MPSVVTTPALSPEIRLAKVISEFEADLSDEQKSAFRTLNSQSLSTTPDARDVMRLTAEVDRRISKKFSSQCFGPRFTNFLHGVQQFAALGDVLVGGLQNLLACGVWSLVRMSLLSIVSLSAYIDKLSSLFMDIGRSAPRYQAMALLYPRSTRLQAHLNEYFIVVVDLCLLQFTSSLSDTHLKAFQTDLDKWAKSIKDEVDLIETQESSGFRSAIRGVVQSSSSQQKNARNMRVLDFCSTYDHETAWKQIRKAGNTSFHTHQAEYQEWRDGSHPCTLMYTGKLGSGKSVLLANIVDNLNLSTEKERSLVAYFFCKHDVPESLQARTIIDSLARQLLCTVPDLGVPAKSCESTYTTGNTEKVLEVLFQGFPSDTKAYVVVDGLDECDNEEKEALVQAVRKIQEKRKVLSITNQLLATCIVSIPADNPDIEAFIEADLERCLREGRMTIGDPALILDIQDALEKGSQGMFLWVALQIQLLCTLADLPRDLSETFARILQRSGSSDRPLQAKTLQLLREALSVTPGGVTWDPTRLLHDVYSALACCGCLLAVDEEEFTYMLNGLDGVKHMSFSLEEAQRTLADTVVTYLGYGVFGTELSRVVILQATMESTSIARHLAMKLLRLRRQPAFDISKAVAEARSSFKSKPEHTFRFYIYASTDWHDHVLYISGHEDAIFKLSTKLIHGQADVDAKDNDGWTPLMRAVWNGYKDIIEVLLSVGKADVEAKDNDGQTPLMWAASRGHRDTVKVLLSVGKADVEAKDNDGQTPLMRAALKGHKDTTEVLLSLFRTKRTILQHLPATIELVRRIASVL
ncbi:hypothetical protein CC86DRAFT_389249 [Ophiobolus disseminans]|uniref:Nephrocystin 3-like N-terminal domain-containing protein n=1 Tax=Ophiobolus disseminans TaxID=1469910 RepID=A0A6A7AHM6_9PLEO|nr:hypothetical protein CC86DRAFT_389249 [Ophiobolus disseminans]